MYIPTIKEKNSSDMNSQKFDILLLFIQHIAEIILFWRFRELYGGHQDHNYLWMCRKSVNNLSSRHPHVPDS